MSRVNIITSFFNTDLALFRKSATSVLGQTYDSITWIVIDDGSTTNQPEEVLNFFKDIKPLKFIKLLANSGPGAARNAGLKQIDDDCEFICFLDSDDFLTNDSIKDRVNALDHHWIAKLEKPAMVYGAKYTLNAQNNPPITTLEAAQPFDVRRFFSGDCFISSNSVMFRRDLFEHYIGAMLENIKMAEDYNLWLKLTLLGTVLKIDNPIYTQVIHGNNLTCNPEVLKTHANCISIAFNDLSQWYEGYKNAQKYNS